VIAIDRERCILCYRCVRFSQEIAEDYQLIFAERGADTFVSTHDGHPYVAPFSGNIVELCPVGALTSKPYRFRARPWDIEGAAGICTLCPAQCNVEFTVRDEKVMRVVARGAEGNPEVDDGWLCDKGRFAYQAIHVDQRITAPLVRDGGSLREVSWERALETAAGLRSHSGRVGALVGGQATNEEGFLLGRLLREGLSSADLDCRADNAPPLELMRALADPALQATVPDLEFAHTVLVIGCEPLDDMPILDLRIRKGVRRRGVNLVVATPRPSALDVNAQRVIRYAPGAEAEFLAGVAAALGGRDSAADARGLAELLREGGEDVVIVWGERLDPAALPHLLTIADRLGLSGRDGAGLLEIPVGSNGRGLREAGAIPDDSGRDATAIGEAAGEGKVTALYLFETDPVRDRGNRELWERALHRAGLVVAHASVLTEGIAEHANVVFPADTYAEKDGTVVHPDGRLQRLRTAIAHPNQVRAGWWVVAEVAKRIGLETGVLTSSMVFKQLVERVPFYSGLTLEEIGGRGVRWHEREAASRFDVGDKSNIEVQIPHEATSSPENGALRLGTYRPIWASPEVEISPALQYTVAHQQAELSPEDAHRLGIVTGETLQISQNGTSLKARAAVRSGVPEGTIFLATGIQTDSANALTEPTVEVRKP
jgi:NADH-quinone oxidoreductase subunit G